MVLCILCCKRYDYDGTLLAPTLQTRLHIARFKVFMAVKIQVKVLWALTLKLEVVWSSKCWYRTTTLHGVTTQRTLT